MKFLKCIKRVPKSNVNVKKIKSSNRRKRQRNSYVSSSIITRNFYPSDQFPRKNQDAERVATVPSRNVENYYQNSLLNYNRSARMQATYNTSHMPSAFENQQQYYNKMGGKHNPPQNLNFHYQFDDIQPYTQTHNNDYNQHQHQQQQQQYQRRFMSQSGIPSQSTTLNVRNFNVYNNRNVDELLLHGNGTNHNYLLQNNFPVTSPAIAGASASAAYKVTSDKHRRRTKVKKKFTS